MASGVNECHLDVSIVVGAGDAYEPTLGTELAARTISLWPGGRVVLDFARVRIVSSAFANAFFIALAREKALDQLRDVVDFRNLRPRVAQVWRRSFEAVRTTESRESTS